MRVCGFSVRAAAAAARASRVTSGSRAEVAALAAALGIEVEEFERRYVRRVGIRKSLIEFPNGDCVFFHAESHTCQVYGQRPRQCRSWPFWASNLATPAAWQLMCRRCPGGNRGRLVPLATIQRRSGLLRL